MSSIDKLKIGSIISDVENNNKYRLIYMFKQIVILVKIIEKDSKLEFLEVLQPQLIEGVNSHKYVIKEPCYKYFDLASLSKINQDRYKRNLDIVNTIGKEYGPCFYELASRKKKPVIRLLSEKYNISTKSILEIEKRYIISGFDPYSLISKMGMKTSKSYNYINKTGRHSKYNSQGIPLTKEIKLIFDKALKYHLSKRSTSFQTTYDWMCSKYFSEIVEEVSDNGTIITTLKLIPEDKRPTKRQMEHYIRSNTTTKQRKIAKTSAREYRNDARMLKSDNLYNVNGPGDVVEMDEVEMDVTLRSEINPENSIGRVIVHCMIDVYSRMIVAVSVSLENNSILGFTNCLINLAEDNRKLCKRYGINLREGLWDINMYPNKIRTDRGVEYRSKEAKRILRELGITLELEPPGMGSMKGQVEQLFHQYHSVQNELVEQNGLITKRHDSKHNDQAVLTLDDLWVFVINQTIAHNMLTMKDYPMTRDMIKKGITPTPIDIWNYGCAIYGAPRPITNLKQFEYTIRKSVQAKISRKGIEWNGLYYTAEDIWLGEKIMRLENKKEKLLCRIDPRDIGSLWYIHDNEIVEAKLNPLRTGNAEYVGMSLKEYEDYQERKQELIHKNSQRDEEIRVARRNALETTTSIAVDSIKDVPVTSSKTNTIRSARREESKFNLKSNTIDDRLNIKESNNERLNECINKENNESVENNIINSDTSIQDLLDMFTNSKTF